MAEQSSADYRGTLGRYALFGEIAAGGMATVHLARLLGPVGFARTVAIKRLHPHLAKDPDFVAMFLEEARLAARVRHPNVVATLDVVSDNEELFLVMEYVAGESLSRLARKAREAGKKVPPRYLVGIVCGALEGLHAAHEATSEHGAPLGMVHRDISPQNIHVGIDGVPRVLDFGIAKATNRVQETRTDHIKGKIAYMSPEQLAKGAIDRRADVYSASVVLWEALTGHRLFKADDVPALVYAIIHDVVRPPSAVAPGIPRALDAIVMKGLERDASKRWGTAREMAEALERVLAPAPVRDVGAWVEKTAGEALAQRQELVHRIESETATAPSVRPAQPSTPSDETSGVIKTDSLTDDDEPTHLAPREPPPVALERETLVDASAAAASATPPARPRVRPASAALALVSAILLFGAGAFFGIKWLALAPPPKATPPVHATSTEPAIIIGGAQRSGTPHAGPTPVAPRGDSSASPAPRAVEPGAPPSSRSGESVAVPSSAARSRGASDDCDPPYTVDARGGRHAKAHCARR